MAGTVKKLQFSEGTNTGAPTDLGLASSTIKIDVFADDTAYVTAKGSAAAAGDVYINTTTRTLRLYANSAWRNVLIETDPSDATKLIVKDLSGQTTGTTLTLASVITADRTITYPDIAGTLAVWNSNALAIPTAGNGSIAANIGANTLTLGGSSSTVVVAGNLQVDGTTTTVNSTNLEVTDQNILVNNGGNDASAEGAGVTVERTGTNGSIAYENALTSKWKVGALGAEVEVATISGAQVITNKDIDGGTAANNRRITLPKASTATLAGLTNKEATVAYDTDLDEPVYNDGSTWLSFGGGGGSTTANIRASEGAGTTTLVSSDNTYQIFNLSANRTLVMPTTGVASGTVYRIVNDSAFTLTIEASDNSQITVLAGGFVQLAALQSAPVDNGDWKMVEHNASLVISNPTTGGVLNVSSASTGEFNYSRVRNVVTFSAAVSFTVTASGDFAFDIALPAGALSNFTSNQDASGTGVFDFGGLAGGYISADTTNDVLVVNGTRTGGGVSAGRICGSYVVK